MAWWIVAHLCRYNDRTGMFSNGTSYGLQDILLRRKLKFRSLAVEPESGSFA